MQEFDFDSVVLETLQPIDHTAFDLMYELPPDSPRPGPSKLFTFQKAPLDAMMSPDVSNVTCMFSAQTGKTLLGTFLVGHNCVVDPHTMMIYFATGEMRDEWLRTKLQPYVVSNPHVAQQMPVPSTPGWNKNHIAFKQGGGIVMRHAGTPNAFAMTSTRTIIADEIDKWDVPGISDPYNALTGRTSTYSRTGYKIVVLSVPNWSGDSTVARIYNLGSKSRFWTPCFKCGEFFVWDWDRDVDVENEVLRCRYCSVETSDFHRWEMLDFGEWRADAPDVTNHMSFRMGQLQSPFVPLHELILNYKAAASKSEFLAEKMAIPPEIVSTDVNLKSSEFHRVFRDRPFDDVNGIFVGVDVQHDRLEYTVLEWSGIDKEPQFHVARHARIGSQQGDDSTEVWNELERQLREFRAERVFVDAGDRQNYVMENLARLGKTNWVPIKGHGPSFDGGVIIRRSRDGVLHLGVDRLKLDAVEILESDKLTVSNDVPTHAQYASQFTSERLQTAIVRGHATKRWVKKFGRRNEAWDCFIYALAASKTYFLENPRYNRAKMVDTTDLILKSLE